MNDPVFVDRDGVPQVPSVVHIDPRSAWRKAVDERWELAACLVIVASLVFVCAVLWGWVLPLPVAP